MYLILPISPSVSESYFGLFFIAVYSIVHIGEKTNDTRS